MLQKVWKQVQQTWTAEIGLIYATKSKQRLAGYLLKCNTR